MGKERMVRTAAQSGDGPLHTGEGVLDGAATATVPVPLKEIDATQSIALGFRQGMFDMRDEAGHGGGVTTGAGWGTDAIILTWGDRRAVVRGRDLLRVWVETFAPEDAAQMPR